MTWTKYDRLDKSTWPDASRDVIVYHKKNKFLEISYANSTMPRKLILATKHDYWSYTPGEPK